MSDLQCAATLLLAQYGDADDSLPGDGREQPRALGRSLRDARLASIYTSATSRAVQSAKIVAAETGVQVVVREGLRDRSAEESGPEVRERVWAELETIADLHRGETVLVVSHTGALEPTVPGLVGLGCAVVELAVDADGWVLRGWAEEQTGERPGEPAGHD